MRTFTRSLALAGVLMLAGSRLPAATTPTPTLQVQPTTPFKLELEEIPGSQLPALHSFISAAADGKWLILGGRTAGLHGFGNGKGNFPADTFNHTAYVIDPAANAVLGSVDVTKALPAALAGPLAATNCEFTQAGNDLYIVGGYGFDPAGGGFTTWGSLIKVDVSKLMNAIVNQQPIADAFQQAPAPDNRLKVTGGALRAYQGGFYVFFGQDFSGNYSVENRDYNRAGGQFQKYTQKVRQFTLNRDLSINSFVQVDGGYDASLPYNRRDLNAVDVLERDGLTPAVQIYGGVFRAGQVAGHVTPIWLGYASSPTYPAWVQWNTAFRQGLNHYDCANLSLFDATSASTYTTLFGGISQYHYDADTGTLVQDEVDLANAIDGLPFVQSISTIQRQSGGQAYGQWIQPVSMPGYLGTDAQFLASASLPAGALQPNGVIRLAALSGRTLAGHIYGGIESFAPYTGTIPSTPEKPSSTASKRLFRVWVTPGASPVTAMPPLPTHTTPYTPPTNSTASK